MFLRFDRLLSDPRTDGNSQQVFFRRDEHFQILVRQAAEAPIGTAQRVPLLEDEILVCDVLRRAGQSQIIEPDIDQARRQAFVFSTGNAVEIDPNPWEHIAPAVNTVQSAFNSVDTVFTEHFNGANPHKAKDVTFDPYSFVDSDNVQNAVIELVAELESISPVTPGASRIGAKQMTGNPVTLPTGTVDSHVAGLLAALNAHRNANDNIHPAAGIDVADAPNRLNADQVEDALQEILQAFEQEHRRNNQTNSGRHSTITQPVLGAGRVLLFHSQGSGSSYSQLRIFSDSSEVWLTVNANWNGAQWIKDTQGASGGIRLERSNIRFVHHYHASDLSFTDWSTTYRFPMASTTNSAMEVSGDVQEIGRVGIRATNPLTTGATLSAGGTVTFRNRFPGTPSSISFTHLQSSNWSASPALIQPDRDGFSYYGYQYLNGNVTGWWYGLYTATA